jgi:hypothetical protein
MAGQWLAESARQLERMLELKATLRGQLSACRERYARQRETLVRCHEMSVGERKQQFQDWQATQEAEYTQRLETARVALDRGREAEEQRRAERGDELARQRSERLKAAREDAEQTSLVLVDEQALELRRLGSLQEQFAERCGVATEQLDELWEAAREQLARHGVTLPDGAPPAPDKRWRQAASTSLLQMHEQELQQQIHAMADARAWPAARFLIEHWVVLIALALMGIAAWPLGLMTDLQPLAWGLSDLGVGVTLAVMVDWLVARHVRQRLQALVPEWQLRLHRSATLLALAESASQRELAAASEAARDRATQARQRAMNEAARLVEQAEGDYRARRTETDERYRTHVTRLQAEWERQTDDIRGHYLPVMQQRRKEFERETLEELKQHSLALEREQLLEAIDVAALRQRWQAGVKEYDTLVSQIEQSPAAQPGLERIADWRPSSLSPNALAFGRYALPIELLDREWAGDVEPRPMPALLSYPERGSLVLEGAGVDFSREAIRVLRQTVLKLVASFPPGALRLTIFDPQGLGENFSGLMHLADFDERLVNHRIWTEASHLQQRLADLTEHMERVLQDYLRNQYATIEDYNRQAGEVAEPFRVLVVAGFPHQFSDEATARLVRIFQKGWRCGVHVLMSVDTDAKMPRGLLAGDLEPHAQVLRWRDARFQHSEPPFGLLPLSVDEPVDEATVTRFLSEVGGQAKQNRRVEVPFSWLAPPPGLWWSSDCAEELYVPLGRAGATQQLALQLGRGTAQHVLVAGKTGSGKSTLLHALITNAALRYSPDQLQFFLVDFKKGVEFKPYAAARLPHAAVVAIESEREFGLSVLQRLDQELRRRGDLYREAGVQNLAMYRAARPGESMPRMLLVVDEFQEFFVKDDRVSHEAGLLLDRLVRQGRAFGIHVILGSQTLAGAYSLARSTLGQMAVRIALECSAADAHVILSEDNTAARMLGRPGEAIYNDANGMAEGNHPFQVVWLADAERNEYLRGLGRLAVERGRHDPPPIIFEGQSAADLRDNGELDAVIQRNVQPDASRVPRAWLGAAVEIKEPVSMAFRRQAGTNLLLVGSSRDLATGLIASSVVSLALADRYRVADPHRAACAARFELLVSDEHEELPNDGWITALHDTLQVDLRSTGPAEAAARVAALAAEVDRRLAAAAVSASEIYLVIHDLGRFRTLQPSPDDYGLGSFSAEQAEGNAAAQLARILREGPAVGVHTLVWADGHHTLSRWFERGSLRDFAHRVLLQMSAVDSSHLMDSVAASQLGGFRALFHDHERGHAEKFRPYGVPDAAWLRSLASPKSSATESSATEKMSSREEG